MIQARQTRPALPALALLLLTAAACNQTVEDVTPIGGDTPSAAEIERFVRRLHLDLTARPPSDEVLADEAAAIGDAGNTAEMRRTIADGLVDSDDFPAVWIDELENRVFGGQTRDARYGFLCGVLRTVDPACNACAPPPGGDACGGCACPALTALVDERAELEAGLDDLAGGAPTAAIERRYASAQVFSGLSASPDAAVASLFDVFLARPAEADELANGRAMFVGALIPGAPAGLLFHRHGSSYADLVDIVFESEVYREAAVATVFERYLGRPPTPVELGHFSATLDAGEPDVRDVIRAVVSSREYFEQ